MSDSSLPEAGARLTLDLSEWESNWSSAIGDAETLQTTIDDLGGSVDIDINVTGDDTLPFDEIPESTDTEVNVTENADTKSLLNGLTFLVMKEKIEWAIEIAGNVWEFFGKIENLVVSPFLDIEDAVARINAQTGGTGIDDLAQFIRDIQAADLGTGVDQITQVVIAAKQLGAPIQEATTAALTFTHTFDNEDPVTVLTTLNSLVQTGLVPNLQDAADLMVVFFQQGGNKGGDALSVVNEYSQSWEDMGLTITEALSLVTSLLGGGVDTAGDAAKMVQTFDDAMTAAAADPSSQQAKMLKMMGIDNPKDAGQAIGAETIDGFVTAFNDLPADQQDLVSGLFFGKGGKKFTGAIEEATTQSDMFSNVTDAAAAAASEIDNSLRGAIDDFVLAANTALATLLSSEGIDLPGKIEALKQGFQEALGVLANGGSVGEAIEVGLNIPGFNDSVNRFSASIGNFVISVLEIVAGIQEFLGKDSTGTKQQITSAEKQQLPYNLTVANPDEIAGEIDTAIARGLNADDIIKAAGTAVTQLVSTGNADDIAKAQALVDSIKTLPSTGLGIAPNLDIIEQGAAEQSLASGDTEFAEKQGWLIHIPTAIDTSDLQSQIDTAIEEAKPVPPEGWWDNFKIPTDKLITTDTLQPEGRSMSDTAGGTQWWNSFAGTEVQTAIDDTSTAMDNLGASTEDTMTALTNAAGMNTQTIVDGIVAMQEAANAADEGIKTAFTENTVTESFAAVAAAAQASFPPVIQWMAQVKAASAQLDVVVSGHVQHLINILHDLQFLSAQVATGVQQAITLGGQLPGGSSVTNNNNNVTVNNNVQSNAQAAANGYAIGASLRPGGA